MRSRRASALRQAVAWLGLLGLGEAGDLVTTRLAIAQGAAEVNPIAAWLISHGLLEMVKVSVFSVISLAVVALIVMTSRAPTERAMPMRAWALRAIRAGAIALVAVSLLNVGVLAMRAALI